MSVPKFSANFSSVAQRRRQLSDEENGIQFGIPGNFIAQAIAVHTGHQNVGNHGVDLLVFEGLQWASRSSLPLP